MTNNAAPLYLKKSATFFRIYASLFLFSIIMSTLVRPLVQKDYSEVFDLLVGLPIFPVFVMAPMGLFYSWKSSKRKEGLTRTRFGYFAAHLFFCVIILLFIAIFVNDISKLL